MKNRLYKLSSMVRKVINVGVIGIGNMGQNHARVYSELPGARLLAIADFDKRKGEKLAERYGCRYYKDYREMLEQERLDAVSVAVPTAFHKKITMDCLKQGVSVLVEKPIADKVSDAEEMINEAKERALVLSVGHIERFNPAVQKLKELINQDKFGKITSIWIKRVGLAPPKTPDTDVIIDLAVHDIDVCNFLLGRLPKEVYARAGKALYSTCGDYASILLDYGGVNVGIQVNWLTPVKIRELAMTGIKGYVELNYITQSLRVYESSYKKTFCSFGDFLIKFGAPNVEDVKIEVQEPLRLELQNFISHIQNGDGMIVSGEEGLTNLLIALKAVESYKLGRVMKISIQ